MHKDGFISNDRFLTARGLESHLREHLRTANSGDVLSASTSAKLRTGTSLSVSDVMGLYCTVRHVRSDK